LLLQGTAYTQLQPMGCGEQPDPALASRVDCKLVVEQNAARTGLEIWRSCFSVLVVAVDPSFFNNNQGVVGAFAFWVLAALHIAGWLWRIPQADGRHLRQNNKGAEPVCSPTVWGLSVGFLFGFDKVFMDAAEILFAPAGWGLRLAWSRLVDLGSIDSGSNPGGPTT
jgi:hypothetical protein